MRHHHDDAARVGEPAQHRHHAAGRAPGPVRWSVRRAREATDRSTVPTRPTRVCAARPTSCRCGCRRAASTRVRRAPARSLAAGRRRWCRRASVVPRRISSACVTVSRPCTTSSWGTMPIRVRNDAYSACRSLPSNDTAPPVGRADHRRSPGRAWTCPSPRGRSPRSSARPGGERNPVQQNGIAVRSQAHVAYLETAGRCGGLGCDARELPLVNTKSTLPIVTMSFSLKCPRG